MGGLLDDTGPADLGIGTGPASSQKRPETRFVLFWVALRST